VHNSQECVVRVRDLTVAYAAEDSSIRALDGVSVDIHAAEVVGILGESGCGKSTLASSLLRLLPPNALCSNGKLLFQDRDLLLLSESELRAIRGRKVSLIPQDPAVTLNPVITAGSQIAEVLRAHFPLSAAQRRQRTIESLQEVGFSNPQEIYSAYPHQLSGGQRQRIAIAQAVVCRPALLVADEPTSKLDVTLQAEMIALFSQIRQQHGTAILFITHDPTLFAGFADRIAVMYAGRVVEVGSSSQIFANPFHPYTHGLVQLKASRGRGHFPVIAGEAPDPTCVPIGCCFAARCPERMEVCTLRYPTEFIPEPHRAVNCFKYGE
jgi:oligopeptide/dipeptide ABC transporter ATP-binding protein